MNHEHYAHDLENLHIFNLDMSILFMKHCNRGVILFSILAILCNIFFLFTMDFTYFLFASFNIILALTYLIEGRNERTKFGFVMERLKRYAVKKFATIKKDLEEDAKKKTRTRKSKSTK